MMNQFMKVMKVERVINLWNENEAKVQQQILLKIGK